MIDAAMLGINERAERRVRGASSNLAAFRGENAITNRVIQISMNQVMFEMTPVLLPSSII